MRILPMGFVLASFAVTAPAQTQLGSITGALSLKVVLPNCCTPVAGVFVLNPTTGLVERALSTGVHSTSGAVADGLALLHNGSLAVIVSTDPLDVNEATVLTIVNPQTGAPRGSLTIPGLPSDLGVNPVTGVIYVGYSSNTVRHMQEISPGTLTVLKDVVVSGYSPFLGNVGILLVSPNGKQFFLQYGGSVYVYSAMTMTQIASISGPDQLLGVSPDSSTLYAASDYNGSPTNSVFAVDLATFSIQQTVAIPQDIDPYTFPGAVSTDGTTILLNLGSAVMTLDAAILSTTATTPMPSGYSLSGIVASSNGSVYLLAGSSTLGNSGAQSEAFQFDPATNTITGQFALAGSQLMVPSADGAVLYLVTGTSTVAELGADPSTTIEERGLAGTLARGQSLPASGVYDPKDDLILIPDGFAEIEVLSASTLTLRGVIQTGAGGPVAYRNSGFYPAFGTAGDGESLTGEVLQFDPATMSILNTISIPVPLGENLGSYGQIAARGTDIYIPYDFFYECICIENDRGNPPSNPPPVQGIAVINTEASTLVANLPIAFESVYGFVIPIGSNYGYLSAEVNEVPELIQINLETGTSVRTVAAGGVGNLLSSPDGTTLYLNAGSGLYAIDAQTLATTNSAGLSYKAFAITPDGQYLYCADFGQVDIVSTASLRVVGVIPAPAASDQAPTPGAPIMVSR